MAMEAAGMVTVGISLCEEITRKVRPPRTLYVPFAFGYPLGEANDPALQTEQIRRTLGFFENALLRPNDRRIKS